MKAKWLALMVAMLAELSISQTYAAISKTTRAMRQRANSSSLKTTLMITSSSPLAARWIRV